MFYSISPTVSTGDRTCTYHAGIIFAETFKVVLPSFFLGKKRKKNMRKVNELEANSFWLILSFMNTVINDDNHPFSIGVYF